MQLLSKRMSLKFVFFGTETAKGLAEENNGKTTMQEINRQNYENTK